MRRKIFIRNFVNFCLLFVFLCWHCYHHCYGVCKWMCLNSSEMLGITNRLTLLEKFPYSEFLRFVFFRIHTAQKIKFTIKSFFSKCDQIYRKLRIWSHLLKKSSFLMQRQTEYGPEKLRIQGLFTEC